MCLLFHSPPTHLLSLSLSLSLSFSATLKKSIIDSLLAKWEGQACHLLRNLLERYASHPEEFAMDLDMTSYMWLPGEQSWKWSKGSPEGMAASLEFLQMRARGCTPQLAR